MIMSPSSARSAGGYFSVRPYRSHDIFTDAEGRHYYEERADKGRPGLKVAVDFIKKFHGAHNGRLQGILNPAQAETCEPSLLRRERRRGQRVGRADAYPRRRQFP